MQAEIALTLIELPDLNEAPSGALTRLIAQRHVWLSPMERARIERAKLPGLALRQTLTRLALRAVLARVIGGNPAALSFEIGSHGKPALANMHDREAAGNPGTSLAFNLSHSGQRLLIGVYCGQPPVILGVDIERARDSTDVNAIVNHYFAVPEQAYLAALQGKAKRTAFFDLWALKESFIKATGLGLAQGLQSFAFHLEKVNKLQVVGLAQSVDALRPQLIQLAEINDVGNSQDNYTNKCIDTDWACVDRSWHWHSWLAHLPQEYRLAVTLGSREPVHACLSVRENSLAELLS